MGVGKERKKHPVWEYFECVEDKGGEKAKCKLCPRKSIIVATTTALKKHIKSLHRKESKVLEERIQSFEKSRKDSKVKKEETKKESLKILDCFKRLRREKCQ